MPGSPSVALAAPWSSWSVLEASAGACSARSVPGRALSPTASVHSELPQEVARVRHLMRTCRACCRAKVTVCVKESSLAVNGSGTPYS